jgi:hypothetical protein
VNLQKLREKEHEMTKPTMALLDYLHKQGMSLDED